MMLLIALHNWPIKLLQENHNNIKAKEVLQKLGSCDTLLRRVLRRVIAGEMSCTLGAAVSLKKLVLVDNFFMVFLHCLSPLPRNRDIDSLVRRARSIIAVAAQDPEWSTGAVNT
jgi:hypothetical protein